MRRHLVILALLALLAAPAASDEGAPPAGEPASVKPEPPPVAGEKPAAPAKLPSPPEGFVYVAGGPFFMGTDAAGEPTNESPMHETTLKPFFIAEREVTNAEYAKFIEAKGYETEKHWSEAGRKWLAEAGRKLPVEWEQLKVALGEEFGRHPVVGVSWFEAEAYANFAGRRLPTEAEWERAARGTDRRAFPWGEDFAKGLRDKKPEGEAGRTHPVGANPGDVSPVGCRDMGGNVAEWTASDFAPYPGTKYKSRYWGENARRTLKVARGGAWRWIEDARSPVAYKCRTSYRLVSVQPEVGCSFIGIRLAADAVPAEPR